RSGMVSAEGDLDFRGTLGVAKDAPVGFAQIRLRFDLDTDAAGDKLDQLLKLTERYCVVYQTIRNGPPVEIRMERSGYVDCVCSTVGGSVPLRCERKRASKGDGRCTSTIHPSRGAVAAAPG